MRYIELLLAVLESALARYWPVLVCAGFLFGGWLWVLRRMTKTPGISRGKRDAVHMFGVLFFLACAAALVWVAAIAILGPARPEG